MIRNIIFDLGGVIITLDPQEAIRRFRELGLHDAVKQLDSYTQTGIFGDLERGNISDETFRSEISKMVNREVSWDECRYAWLGYAREVPNRHLDELRKLREEGYRLFLLSNTNPYMMSWVKSPDFDGEGHSIEDYLDGCYLSYEIGVMKPDRRFFEHVLHAAQLNPSETLFLDDGPANVAMAGQLGIATMCPKNGEDWTKDIYTYLK